MTDDDRDLTLRKRYLDWRYGGVNLIYIVAMHAVLVGWYVFGPRIAPFEIYAVIALVFGVVYFRILTEWFHEATHWNLVPGRRTNDALGDLLIGTPLGTRVSSNRPGHFRHHAMSAYFVDDDPDTALQAASSRKEVLTGILFDLSGITAVKTFVRAARLGTDAAASGIGGTLAWFGWLILIHGGALLATIGAGRTDIYPLYFVSLICLYPVANRFRVYLQHASIGPHGRVTLIGSGAARTYHGSLWSQLAFQSPMIMYHHEHHARPSLPYRALRAMSERSEDPNRFGERPTQLIAALLAGN